MAGNILHWNYIDHAIDPAYNHPNIHHSIPKRQFFNDVG